MNRPTDQQFDEFVDADWLSHSEGQLSVDVVETRHEILVYSAIAGVSANDLDITLSDDTLTIRGKREQACEEKMHDRVHVRECHWGAFSRSIVLPAHVDPDSVDAILKRGILTIRLKKVDIDKNIPVLDLDDI